MNKYNYMVLLGSALLLSGCAKPSVDDAVDIEHGVPVRVMRVEMRQITDVVSLPGVLEPVSDLWIAAEQGGRIVEMNVEEGDRVTAADTLFSVDARLLKMGLRQARIDAENAGRDAERHKLLAEDGALAERDYDQIIFRRDMTDAALRLAEVMVSRCVALAPVDGYIEKRLVDAGEYVSEGQAVLRLVNTDSLYAVVDIPEKDVVHVKNGMPVRVSTVAGVVQTGRLDFVAMTADRSTHTFRTKILLENNTAGLRGGMLVEACIDRGTQEVIAVPLTSIVPRRGEHVVFLVDNGHAVMRVVQILRFSGESAIIDGLAPGDKVIVDGHRGMRDGIAVRVDEIVTLTDGPGRGTCILSNSKGADLQ